SGPARALTATPPASLPNPPAIPVAAPHQAPAAPVRSGVRPMTAFALLLGGMALVLVAASIPVLMLLANGQAGQPDIAKAPGHQQPAAKGAAIKTLPLPAPGKAAPPDAATQDKSPADPAPPKDVPQPPHSHAPPQ